jgi:hypothetical protein
MSPALPAATDPPLVLVSWDGRSEPLRLLEADAAPAFEVLLFDYSGQAAPAQRSARGLPCTVLAAATECKGEIYAHLARWLATHRRVPEYVALIDDDVLVAVSALNRALHVARCHGLDVFAPSLSHDSVFTHRFTLHRPHRLFHRVPWVEVMMPFYRGALFTAGAPYYEGNVSSWGIDKFLVPTLQQLLDVPHAAIVDVAMASHLRPITSGEKVYRNGLTARQELAQMRERCIALVRERRPDLIGSPWYRQTFERRHALTRWQRLETGLGRKLREWLDRST